ncbi:MAG TPA: HAD family hydrolase, partial [Anaerolineae bacterium]|nr:HAD family hydrolase [Anaerolineae bacterium]
MTYTLLVDLDDTLLNTNIESFVPAYFQALSDHMAPYVSAEIMLSALLSATRLMMDSDDPSRTLQEVFKDDFYAKIGIPEQDIGELLDDFYDNVFPKLRVTTSQHPEAVPLINWAISQGCRVAIATDPLFPR